MITLTRSLEEHLASASALHTRLCPRQVIGVRMARLACVELGIDPAIDRKQIYVHMECGRCAADAVIAVTGASPTNQLMVLMGYGKVAATFVNLRTGSALRVSEREESRSFAADVMYPDLPSWEAQLQGYQIMPDEMLLNWQSVRLMRPLPVIPEKHSVICEDCHERITEHCEVMIHGRAFCKACAWGAYYQPVQAVPIAEEETL